MSRVMMHCGRTGKPAFTGLELPHGESLEHFSHRKFVCSNCGFQHSFRNLYFEEDGPTDADRHWFALDLIPDVAAEVGILISIFAMIEFCLPSFFQSLTRVESGDAHMIMGYFKSFGDKIELFKTIIKNRTQDNKQTREIASFLPRLSLANSIRNKYVHARFSIGAHDNLHLSPFANDSRRKPTTEVKSLEQVCADTKILRSIAVEANALV